MLVLLFALLTSLTEQAEAAGIDVAGGVVELTVDLKKVESAREIGIRPKEFAARVVELEARRVKIESEIIEAARRDGRIIGIVVGAVTGIVVAVIVGLAFELVKKMRQRKTERLE